MRGKTGTAWAHVINAPVANEEQQKVILELFLAGHSALSIPGLMNYDVAQCAVDDAIRAALDNLRDYAKALRDTLEGMR